MSSAELVTYPRRLKLCEANRSEWVEIMVDVAKSYEHQPTGHNGNGNRNERQGEQVQKSMQNLGQQAQEKVQELGDRAQEMGAEAIAQIDSYLRPVGLSLRDKPTTTLVVLGGLAVAVGAMWMKRRTRNEVMWNNLMSQVSDYARRSRIGWVG